MVCCTLLQLGAWGEVNRMVLKEDTSKIGTVPLEKDLEEITVTSTRTNNRTEENPTKVEVLGLEEVNEEVVMNPGNITKLLGETSGILSRQASSISGNVSFRILGLPGQYTQLLQDGFPLYSGPSAGLSLLQIAPLDLQQVEIIKGPSSALFGGEAIAGIVNLVTKRPRDTVGHVSAILNQTSQKGQDASVFFTKQSGKLGFTLLASGTDQQAMDLVGNGFTTLPALQQFSIRSKLFYDCSPSLHFTLALQSSAESRTAGDMHALTYGTDSVHNFVVHQNTYRNAGIFTGEKKLSNGDVFLLKASLSNYERSITENLYAFAGNELSSFGEFSWLHVLNRQKLVIGTNWITDRFDQSNAVVPVFNYVHSTVGVFAEDNLSLGNSFEMQGGLRMDEQNIYGLFILPRLSAIYHFDRHFYIRCGAGEGYRTPSVFTDDAESQFYKNIAPLPPGVKAEQAGGFTTDLNYKVWLNEEVMLAVNQSLFYTKINNALVPDANGLGNGILEFNQLSQALNATGGESSFKLKMDETEFSAGYTHIVVQANGAGLPYTPKDRLVLSLSTGEEKSWRAGLEAFYTGSQLLENQSLGRDFWIFGALVEKTWGHFSLVANVENLLNVKQSDWGPVVTGTWSNPVYSQTLY